MSSAKVLVVDDDSNILNAVSYFLREAGYDVHAYCNPQEAFAAALVEKPDVAILDVVMPGMNGFDLCMLLRQQPETKQLPVVFLSGLTDKIEKLIAKSAGATCYIEKPFKKEDLLDALRTALAPRAIS